LTGIPERSIAVTAECRTFERIDRFEHDVQDAERSVTRCEGHVSEHRREFVQEVAWEVQHGWRAERLGVIEIELA
jgi:hypothetical protein